MDDEWEWDRKSIKLYREKHEPYSDYESFMLSLFGEEKSPFKPNRAELWLNTKDEKCQECAEGKIKSEDTILPSGLRVHSKRCSNINCRFFENLVMSSQGEILDFTHIPKREWQPPKTKFSSEEIRKIEKTLRKRR